MSKVHHLIAFVINWRDMSSFQKKNLNLFGGSRGWKVIRLYVLCYTFVIFASINFKISDKEVNEKKGQYFTL